VVEAVEHRTGTDHLDRSSTWAQLRPWRLQSERPVGPVAVVLSDVLGQDRAQVPLVNGDDVVDALPPQGADHALGHGIGSGRPDWREHDLDAERLGSLAEVSAVDRVSIADELPGSAAPRRRLHKVAPAQGGACTRWRLHKVAPHPGTTGMRRHRQVHQLAAAMSNDQQDVERRESDVNVSVWTTNRSAAQIAWAWVVRKVRHVWLGGRWGPRHRERRIERLLTTMPSFSNSPLIRSLP
jgi:hypothetical protein